MKNPPSVHQSASDLIFFHGCTDVGLMRKHNEDAFGFFTSQGKALDCPGSLPAGSSFLAVVSDGVGGHDGGDIASAYVVSALPSIVASCDPPKDSTAFNNLREILKSRIEALNSEVLNMAAERNQERGMAATLTAAWFLPDTLVAIHAGDSRLYRLRQGSLSQLTIDDTIAGRGLADGSLTEEQARKHPKRHVLQNAIGIPKEDFSVAINTHDIAPGDVYLLCSDGLTDGLMDKDLAKAMTMVHDGENTEEVLERLVDGANQGSGKDNITIQIVHYPAPAISSSPQSAVTGDTTLPPKNPNHPTMSTWSISVITILLIGFMSLATLHLHHNNERRELENKLHEQYRTITGQLADITKSLKQQEQESVRQLTALNERFESFESRLQAAETSQTGFSEQIINRYNALKADFDRLLGEARSGIDEGIAQAMERLDAELDALRKNADAIRASTTERYQRTRREIEQVQQQLSDWWQQWGSPPQQQEDDLPDNSPQPATSH